MSSETAIQPAPLAPEPEGKPMPALEIISTIVTAIELFSKVPKLAGLIKQAGIDIFAFRREPEPVTDPNSPLKIIIDKELRRVNNLIQEYYKFDEDNRYSDMEKDAHLKKVAARLCALLKSIDPINAKVPDYDKLVKLYCESIPKSLA